MTEFEQGATPDVSTPVVEQQVKPKRVRKKKEPVLGPDGQPLPEAPKAPRTRIARSNKVRKFTGTITPESKITWLCTANPRRGEVANRFNQYFGAETVAEYMTKGGEKGDLLWDLRHGHLSIEGIELSERVKPGAQPEQPVEQPATPT